MNQKIDIKSMTHKIAADCLGNAPGPTGGMGSKTKKAHGQIHDWALVEHYA
jgi:hypothetical protein